MISSDLKWTEQVNLPVSKANRSKLENVQRRATKMVKGLKRLSYEQRIILGLDF